MSVTSVDKDFEALTLGSGNLIQTLLRHALVDQYRLWIFPLVIGSGKRLFSEGTIPSGLKLVDSKVSTTGVVIGTYEPAGEIVTGSFALDLPQACRGPIGVRCANTPRLVGGMFSELPVQGNGLPLRECPRVKGGSTHRSRRGTA